MRAASIMRIAGMPMKNCGLPVLVAQDEHGDQAPLTEPPEECQDEKYSLRYAEFVVDGFLSYRCAKTPKRYEIEKQEIAV
jgi:hypothetical protein